MLIALSSFIAPIITLTICRSLPETTFTMSNSNLSNQESRANFITQIPKSIHTIGNNKSIK